MANSVSETLTITGEWRPLLAAAGRWLVTGNDNFDFCWSEAPPAADLGGHFRLARTDLAVTVLAGETFYVRALRPMRFTVTPEA